MHKSFWYLYLLLAHPQQLLPQLIQFQHHLGFFSALCCKIVSAGRKKFKGKKLLCTVTAQFLLLFSIFKWML